MSPRSFTVLYEPADGGGYYAYVPALDLTTEGRTLKEAKAMARDAIAGYLDLNQAEPPVVGRDISGETRNPSGCSGV